MKLEQRKGELRSNAERGAAAAAAVLSPLQPTDSATASAVACGGRF